MKKLIFTLLLLIIPFITISASSPQITSISYDNNKVSVEGSIDGANDTIVQVALFDGQTLVSLGTTKLNSNNEYSYTSESLNLSNGKSYTVKTALYNGECPATKTFVASVTNPQTWDNIYTYIII